MDDHKYSLFDIYGPEYADLIEDIPNPIEAPTKMLQDFCTAFNTLGVWCAERASLLLIIKIEKLKTCEKYERHFLLLSTMYTEMMRVQKICDVAFDELTEIEKMTRFSTPKLLKLVEIFKDYKPDHIQKTAFESKPDKLRANDITINTKNKDKDNLEQVSKKVDTVLDEDHVSTCDQLEIKLDEPSLQGSKIADPAMCDNADFAPSEILCDEVKLNEVIYNDAALNDTDKEALHESVLNPKQDTSGTETKVFRGKN